MRNHLAGLGLRTLREYISAVGGSVSGDEFGPIVLHYLLSVFHPQIPPGGIGEESTREPRTYAQVIDSLLAGRTVPALDNLFQGFKAKTQAVTDGTWQTAKWLELMPMNTCAVASPEELEIAAESCGSRRSSKSFRGRARKSAGSWGVVAPAVPQAFIRGRLPRPCWTEVEWSSASVPPRRKATRWRDRNSML